MACPPYPLVLVSWLDHVEHTGWATVDKVRKDAQGGHLVWSVGWLIDESDTHIVVSPHLGIEPDEEATGSMEIVRSVIKTYHTLVV